MHLSGLWRDSKGSVRCLKRGQPLRPPCEQKKQCPLLFDSDKVGRSQGRELEMVVRGCAKVLWLQWGDEQKRSWYGWREASKGLSGQRGSLGPDLFITNVWLMANTPETGNIPLEQCAVRSLTRLILICITLSWAISHRGRQQGIAETMGFLVLFLLTIKGNTLKTRWAHGNLCIIETYVSNMSFKGPEEEMKSRVWIMYAQPTKKHWLCV